MANISSGLNGDDYSERPSKLFNSVEALVNVFYLIENSAHDERRIQELVRLAGPALNYLKKIAQPPPQ